MALKAVCPTSPEHNRFYTVAHTMEEWIVDEEGNFIDLVCGIATTVPPQKENYWVCTACDQEATVTDE